MATLREFLLRSGFDYEHGRIILGNPSGPRWSTPPIQSREIEWDDPMLDKKFDDGFDDAECPEYVAEDEAAIYFPSRYDGTDNPKKVFKNISVYLDEKEQFPYLGGG